jgi:hypothetical protein
MSRQRAHRLTWGTLVVMTVVSFAWALVLRRSFSSPEFVIISFVMYAVVGAVVSWRRPENPNGWVFLCIGVLTGLAGLSGAATEIAVANGSPLTWWGVLAVWYESWFWSPLFVMATAVTFLLYPSGLASPRWRPVLWLTVGATLVTTALQAMAPTLPVGNTDRSSPEFDPASFTVDNPFSPAIAQRMTSADDAWWWSLPLLLVAACGLAAVASAILRTIRARGIEREQMRLFAFAISAIPIYIVVAEQTGFALTALSDLLFAVVLAMVPTACGVAILRYHLYDIDRVIGRTTAYAIVTAVLLAAYAVVVTSLTQVVPDSGSTGAPASWAVAVATLAAAALFRPVLGWARRVVARRFNREQYDAELTVEQFALRLRDEVGPQEVRDDLLHVLSQTMQPRLSSVWLSDRNVS